jgi:hypothetical protein
MNSPFAAKSIDISLRGRIAGSVNGSVVEGEVTASLNTGRGGRSACQFTRLPPNFTATTFGTYA